MRGGGRGLAASRWGVMAVGRGADAGSPGKSEPVLRRFACALLDPAPAACPAGRFRGREAFVRLCDAPPKMPRARSIVASCSALNMAGSGSSSEGPNVADIEEALPRVVFTPAVRLEGPEPDPPAPWVATRDLGWPWREVAWARVLNAAVVDPAAGGALARLVSARATCFPFPFLDAEGPARPSALLIMASCSVVKRDGASSSTRGSPGSATGGTARLFRLLVKVVS